MIRTSLLAATLLIAAAPAGADHGRRHDHEHPDFAVKIDQALLETPEIRAMIEQAIAGKVRSFSLTLEQDGLHARGYYKIPILPDPHFHAVATMSWTAPDVFELRVKRTRVLLFDVTQLVLDSMKKAVEGMLKDACKFQRMEPWPDGSRSAGVWIDMRKIMPTLPKIFLSGVTIRDRTLILKANLPD